MIESIPGKTFLLGEYAVLQGGPALVACTTPYFTLEATCTPNQNHPSLSNTQQRTFSKDSPAGKFLTAHADIFQPWQLTWSSPYGEGGFGGSTAEFLACYRLYHHITKKELSLEKLHADYLRYAYNGQGIPPSGVDLIAQSQLSLPLVWVQKSSTAGITIKPLTWPFPDLSLLFLKTTQKVPTHHHLSSLQALPQLDVLKTLTQQGYSALKEKKPMLFIQTVNEYAEKLSDFELTLPTTRDLLISLRNSPCCLAAKGCGALGADVILAIVPTEKKENFLAQFPFFRSRISIIQQ